MRLEPAGPRKLTPREYLTLRGGIYAPLLDRVVMCESGWKPDAQNKNSSAGGLGQFLDSTWIRTRLKMGVSTDLTLKNEPYANIDTLIFLWDGGKGSSNWNESKFCWKYDK